MAPDGPMQISPISAAIVSAYLINNEFRKVRITVV
jgi:hypothetical protein